MPKKPRSRLTRKEQRDLDVEIGFLEGVVHRDPKYVEALQVLGDNYICASTTITPEHPNGRGDASYPADTAELGRTQPGANDGRAGEEAHGRDASAW